MRRLFSGIVATIALLSCLGCTGKPLTSEECQKLGEKVRQLASGGRNIQAPPGFDSNSTQWDNCQDTWTRAGYDCMMAATQKLQMIKCAKKNR